MGDFLLGFVKTYLYKLDVIASIKEVVSPTYIERERIIFTQPGLRYAQAKSLVDILFKDKSLLAYDYALLEALKEKLLSDVKGKMVEDILIYETSLYNKNTFKLYFLLGGEYDMVTLDDETYESSICEIKYSNVVNSKQYRFLNDSNLNQTFEKKYYPIKDRVVFYQGESKQVDNILYKNIDEYLKNIK